MRGFYAIFFIVGLCFGLLARPETPIHFAVTEKCKNKFQYYKNVEKLFYSTTQKTSLMKFYRNEGEEFGFIRKNDIVYVYGRINSYLLKELQSQETSVLVLGSRGGRVDAMKKIAEYVRNKNIYTYVPPGTVCASACAMIFASSINRTMGESSWLMFHPPVLGSLCRFQYEIVRKSKGRIKEMVRLTDLYKRKLRRLHNQVNLQLLDYLGINFLDRYLFVLDKKNTRKSGVNILDGNNYFISARTARGMKIIDRVDGTKNENFTYINKKKIELRYAQTLNFKAHKRFLLDF